VFGHVFIDLLMNKVFRLQVKPKSSFIYYYGEDVNNTTSKQSSDEGKDDMHDGDVLNMEPVIPSRPR